LKLAIVLIFAVLGVRGWMAASLPITDSTEARYAEISRKMVETANWITPQFDYGVPFWGKPPLAFWVSAAGIKLFGTQPLVARAGIFLTSAALLLVYGLWIREAVDKRLAVVATLMLASSAVYFISAAAIMTDMMLAAAVTLSLIAFWRRAHGGSRTWGFIFFISLGMGLLAKGPIALIFVFFPVIFWSLTVDRKFAAIKRFSWVSGSAVTLLVAAPWYAFAEYKTPGFLNYFIIGEHVKRFLVSGWKGDLYGHAHSMPLGMVWVFLVIGMIPWSLTLAPSLFTRENRARLKERFKAHRSLMLFCLFWMLGPLCLFTLSHHILWPYVLPGVPGAILLLALALFGTAGDSQKRLLAKVSAISAIMMAVLVVATLWVKSTGLIMEHSQKRVVDAYEALRPTADSGLYYFGDLYHSAEYYSGGKAKHLEAGPLLIALMKNATTDFIVVSRRKLDSLPREVRDGFPQVGQYNTQLLLEEKTTPALPPHPE